MKQLKISMAAATILLLLFSYSHAQKLLVHNTDDTGKDSTYTIEVGDVILLAHQKEGHQIHYFQGKVTGIFKNRGVVRVFDYARSGRVLAIVGKKIRISEIVAIKMMDKTAYQKREKGKVAMAIASSIGGAIGGRAGTGVQWGAAAGSIGNDLLTREEISKQHIKVEFKD